MAISALLRAAATPYSSPTQPLTTEDLLQLAATAKSRVIARPEWMADGKRLIVTTRDQASGALFLEFVDVASGQRVRFVEGWGAKPSPDGAQIAYLAPDDGLSVMAADGTEPRPVAHVAETAGMRYVWSPDSRYLAYTHPVADAEGIITHIEVWLIDLTGAQPRRLLTRPDTTLQISWMPDGNALAYHGGHEDTSESELGLLAIATGQTHVLVDNPGVYGTAPTPAPDGQTIAFAYTPPELTLAGYTYLALIPTAGGLVQQLLGDIMLEQPLPMWWSDDGLGIYSACKPGVFIRVCFTTRAGEVSQIDLPPLQDILYTARSPDGAQLAWYATDARSAQEVWVAGHDGQGARRLLDLNPTIQRYALGAAEELRWQSFDGLELAGLLIKPLGYQLGVRYPVVVDVHGGPEGGIILDGPAVLVSTPLEWHLWAARGYAVFVPGYRSNLISGIEPILQGRELGEYLPRDGRDIDAGVDHLIALGIADPQRLALIGHSNGGVMASWIATQTTRYQAIVAKEGTPDLAAEYQHPACQSIDFCRAKHQWYFQDSPPIYAKNSAITFVNQVQTPILFLSGGESPYAELVEPFYQAIKARGITTEHVVYPNEGHTFIQPDNQRDALSRVLAWVDAGLQQGPATSILYLPIVQR
jgi:dipeptidyl aminopeptidase/acylaminoacyl peptidase